MTTKRLCITADFLRLHFGNRFASWIQPTIEWSREAEALYITEYTEPCTYITQETLEDDLTENEMSNKTRRDNMRDKLVSKPLVRKYTSAYTNEDKIPPYFKTKTEIKTIVSQPRKIVKIKRRDYEDERGYREMSGVIVEIGTNTLYIASRETGEVSGVPWWAIHDAEIIHEDISL
jgi:hypothetical protein